MTSETQSRLMPVQSAPASSQPHKKQALAGRIFLTGRIRCIRTMNPNSSTPTSCIWPYIPGLVGAGLGLNPSVLHVRQLVEGRVLAAFHRRASNIITKQSEAAAKRYMSYRCTARTDLILQHQMSLKRGRKLLLHSVLQPWHKIWSRSTHRHTRSDVNNLTKFRLSSKDPDS